MTRSARTIKVLFLLLLSLSVAAVGIAAFDGDNQQIYSVLEKAFYLTATDGIWIRPGLNLAINNVSIGSNLKPSVTFTITDSSGQPLDRTGGLTPGTVSLGFLIAYIPQNASQYVSYAVRTQTSPITGKSAVQANTDSGGTYTSLGNGSYTYTYGTTLPSNYDTTATHTIGIYAARDMTSFGLSRYVVDVTKDFVPSGAAVSKIRQVVLTANCNACHDPLSAHGTTGRQAVEICILCHSPQTIDPDTGNTVDMKVMVHKIHYGPNLPSVKAGKPYQIIGFGQSVVDYSNVTFPQDMRNCTTCHKDAQQVNNWMLNPTRDTCGSCHDDINWTTGANHKAGVQTDDSKCASCHQPQANGEWDPSVPGAHTVPYKSNQLVYPKVEITSITNTAPGQKPVVAFKITDKNGNPINPAGLAGSTGRLAVTIAGPTTDYRWYLQETADKAAYANGVATYTFAGVIPATATGSYATEIEGRIVTTLNPGPGGVTGTYQESWPTAVKYFAVTDKTVTPRRNVVDLAKCNKCHDKLQLHGSNRNTIESCVICHNPATTDISQRGTADLPAQSIDLQFMIHRIHTGDNLENDFTVKGFGKSTNNYNEVTYPGDRRDCLQCHLAGTYTVPLPSTATPTTMPRGYWDPYLPTAAACLGCHDSLAAAVHAYVNTSTIGESCAVCHKEGADNAVGLEHAR
jgi:OmcA/MtrC family decaheme c-type cytochrome